MRIVRATLVGLFLIVALTSAIQRCAAESSEQEIRRRARVALVVSTRELPAPAQLAVDDLSTYLQRSLRAIVRRYPPDTNLSALEEDVALIVGAGEDPGLQALLAQSGTDVSTEDLGDEGARIVTTAVAGKPVVVLVGKTWTGAAHATYSFLEQELGIGFFIDGDHIPTWQSVDLSGIDRTEIPRVPIRGLFYHPTWFHPHANCCRLWSFEEWAQYLDWMRHRRLNVLPLFHDDGGYSWGDVLFDAFPQIEKNGKALAKFVTDPTWRTELNKKIIDYARQSGIQIAYNLFYTQIPDFVADAYPDLQTHPLRMRNVGIKFTQPECKELMRKYWGSILDTYGIDDSHLYFICSYKHELPLPDYVDSRNPPTRDAIELIRELDPQAKIYMETWCWNYLHEPTKTMTRQEWLDENALVEWKRFNSEVPKDIGVVDWDRKQEPQRVPDPTFGGRPYIQLTHTTMESWAPPDTVRRHPQWLIEYFGDAIENGAEGILSFHIQANTNPLLADLTAEIGWRDPALSAYYHDYARRRFGAPVADTMADSLAAFCDAVDMQPASNANPVRGTLDDKANFLTFPGVRRSAEEMLYRSEELGDERRQWIEEQIALIPPEAARAAHAVMCARAVAPLLEDDPFYQEYLWQLDYLSARLVGIEALYRSHLVADTDVDEARRLFAQALTAFDTVKALFADNPRYKMNELQSVEPDVPFTQAFLDDWEFRGALDKNAYLFHVVWERFPMFEGFLRSLQPQQLGPVEQSALDVRAWFDVTD